MLKKRKQTYKLKKSTRSFIPKKIDTPDQAKRQVAWRVNSRLAVISAHARWRPYLYNLREPEATLPTQEELELVWPTFSRLTE